DFVQVQPGGEIVWSQLAHLLQEAQIRWIVVVVAHVSSREPLACRVWGAALCCISYAAIADERNNFPKLLLVAPELLLLITNDATFSPLGLARLLLALQAVHLRKVRRPRMLSRREVLVAPVALAASRAVSAL